MGPVLSLFEVPDLKVGTVPCPHIHEVTSYAGPVRSYERQ